MSYAIQNSNKRHLGFMLMTDGPEVGSCIIRSLPKDPDLFESEESNHLWALQQQGEFSWRRSGDCVQIAGDDGCLVATIRDGILESAGYALPVVELPA